MIRYIKHIASLTATFYKIHILGQAPQSMNAVSITQQNWDALKSMLSKEDAALYESKVAEKIAGKVIVMRKDFEEITERASMNLRPNP